MEKHTTNQTNADNQSGHNAGMHQQLDECIRLCLECARICTETMAYCHEMGGAHVRPGHIRLMADCEEICQLGAHFMLRKSEFHQQTCGICAEICERCAEDCEQFDDDARMATCAETCQRCAESCREMARGVL